MSLTFQDKFDILSEIRLSGIVGQEYTRLYGKSRTIQKSEASYVKKSIDGEGDFIGRGIFEYEQPVCL